MRLMVLCCNRFLPYYAFAVRTMGNQRLHRSAEPTPRYLRSYRALIDSTPASAGVFFTKVILCIAFLVRTRVVKQCEFGAEK